MKKIVVRSVVFTFVLFLVFCNRSAAFAHAGQPRLEISLERLNPGGVLDVRGVNFDYEEVVTLTLLGSQSEIALGDIMASVNGEFLYILTLPNELVEGKYYIRGTTTHHYVLSSPLTVWGTAILEGGGQGERDEDDGLLAPMPTYPPAVATVPVLQDPVEAGPTSAWTRNWIALTALMVAVLLGFGILRKMAR